MPTIDPASAASFGQCLSGTADYASCPYDKHKTARTWIEGLMDPGVCMGLLTSQPCSMIKDDAVEVENALTILSKYTFKSGSSEIVFWDYVVDLFAARSTSRQSAATDLAATAAQLARDNPDLSPEEIAAHAELVQFLKVMNGGY